MTSSGIARTNRFVMRAGMGAIAIGLATVAPQAHAQPATATQLEDARKLFQEAYKDEQEGRCEDANRKFLEVAKTKESASVRYRIAKTQVCLNRLKEARDTFRALAASKPTLPVKDQPIADSAAGEAVEIDKKIPKLTVKVQDKAPSDTRVSVDGTPIPSTGTTKPIEVDPGEHTVTASGTGMKPFEKKVKLDPNGGETPVMVQFESATGDTGNNGNVTPPPCPEGQVRSEAGSCEKVPPRDGPGVLPYVLLAGGGLLIFAGAAFLITREGTIDDIKATCPNNVCPTRSQGDIEDKRDQADLFMPLGIGFMAVGAVAAGAGVYFLVRSPKKSADVPPGNGTQPSSPRGQSFHFGPKPVRGGMVLGLGATF